MKRYAALQLIDQVWQENESSGRNSVDHLINPLVNQRRSLSASFLVRQLAVAQL